MPFDGSAVANVSTAGLSPMSPELRALIDRAIIPALVERFLQEHQIDKEKPRDLPKVPPARVG